MWDIVAAEVKKFHDLFEPCCQSGLFGCYLAGIVKSYKGMDKNSYGIKKAKERASKNGFDGTIFELGNVLDYKQKHEAIVGRYVINNKYIDSGFSINDEMLEALSAITNNIILIQPTPDNARSCQMAFERHGFSSQVISSYEILHYWKDEPLAFVIKATK